MLGKHHSQESKAKIAAAKTGQKRTEETKRKIEALGHLAHKKRLACFYDC